MRFPARASPLRPVRRSAGQPRFANVWAPNPPFKFPRSGPPEVAPSLPRGCGQLERKLRARARARFCARFLAERGRARERAERCALAGAREAGSARSQGEKK